MQDAELARKIRIVGIIMSCLLILLSMQLIPLETLNIEDMLNPLDIKASFEIKTETVLLEVEDDKYENYLKTIKSIDQKLNGFIPLEEKQANFINLLSEVLIFSMLLIAAIRTLFFGEQISEMSRQDKIIHIFNTAFFLLIVISGIQILSYTYSSRVVNTYKIDNGYRQDIVIQYLKGCEVSESIINNEVKTSISIDETMILESFHGSTPQTFVFKDIQYKLKERKSIRDEDSYKFMLVYEKQ